MAKMYFCFFQLPVSPSDICRSIDLGECKSVKEASLRVTRMIMEDMCFNPKSYEIDGGSCGSICDESGLILARLFRTERGYKFQAANNEED